MRLDQNLFLALLAELVDENPLAARPVLRILRTEFTDTVPTLAVTLESRPRLLVNLGFLSEHCQTEEHVKACILHEFLHVLLGHTERFKRLTTVQNMALDAVVNAIIHRTAGPSYSNFFVQYYIGEKGLGRLLRPMTEEEETSLATRCRVAFFDREFYGIEPTVEEASPLEKVWEGIYDGKLVVDDVLEIARDLETLDPNGPGDPILIGNHDGIGDDIPFELAEALDEAIKTMNGDSIWRSPKNRGVGQVGYRTEIPKANVALERWKAETFRVLEECLVPDRRSVLTESAPRSYRIPVLTARDRRAFVRSLWSPILPESEWLSEHPRPLGKAHVYLDVSGSMNAEMPHIVELLWQLRRAIKTPFWAFSDVVEPAEIVGGSLRTGTTGGTSMKCVLDHLAKTSPPSAVVFTDGYIEAISPNQIARIGKTRLWAVVTRNGSPYALERAGIPYRQLGRFPE
ncbi:MAG: hypothetical protein SNJ74_04730 [Fimbriimonadaceae bacterium]